MQDIILNEENTRAADDSTSLVRASGRSESAVAMTIQTAMVNPPERPKKQSAYDVMRELLNAGKIQIRPKVAAEWMRELGVQTEERS